MRYLIKVSLFSFLAILFTSNITSAQQAEKGNKHEARINKMAERLSEELNLSDSQTEKVKALHTKFGERKKALKQQSKGERNEATKAAMHELKEDFEKEMQAILTPEQFEKFEALPKRGPRGHHRKHNKAAKAFHKENVYPVLLKQRIKLEDKISEADKAELAELRTVIKAEKEKHKAERKASKKNIEKGAAPNAEDRAAHRAKRKNDPNRLKVKALVEKYEDDIETLLAEVKPELEALKEKFKNENEIEGHARKGKKGKGKRSEHHAKRKMAKFLLMDPNGKNEDISPAKVATITDVNVYPNPSQGVSQVEYTLQSPGMVTIELHDKNGNLIETIEQRKRAAGQHKTSINFAKYTVGVYYVILKDSNGLITSQKVIR